MQGNNITSTFKDFVKKGLAFSGHSTTTSASNAINQPTYFNKCSLKLLRTLKSIKTKLEENRENYFASASFSRRAFTEKDREEFDKQVMELILNTEPEIRELKRMLNNGDKRLAVLSKNDLDHKRTAILCLEEAMKEISSIFTQFKVFRLKQFNRLNELVNFNVQMKEPKIRRESIIDKEREVNPESGELHEENKILVEKYHKKVEQEKLLLTKLEEISLINRKIGEVLEHQNFQTEKINEEMDQSIKNIKGANDNLSKANKLSSEFGRLWAFYFIALGIILIVFDRIKS